MFARFYDGENFPTLLIFDEPFLNQLSKTENISLCESEVLWNKGSLLTFHLGLKPPPSTLEFFRRF